MAERRHVRQDPITVALDQLKSRLATPPGQPAANEGDGLHLLLHHPADTLALQGRVKRWIGTLRREGWTVEVVSLRELLWHVIDGTGAWAEWVEAAGPGDEDGHGVLAVRRRLADDTTEREGLLVGAIRERLAKAGGRAARVTDAADAPAERRLVILVELASLHPWFRAATLPNLLSGHVTCPVVLVFPGAKPEHGSLTFLGLHPSETEYRATSTEVVHVDGP